MKTTVKAILLGFALGILLALPGYAASFPTIPTTITGYEGKQYYATYNREDPPGTWKAQYREQGRYANITGFQIKSIKTTNSKVASVKVNDQPGYKQLAILLKKAGKATVSFKLTDGTQTRSYKIQVTLRSYQNPFKTLTIGGKSYASKFKKYTRYDAGKNLKGTLKFKLNSRYTLKYVTHESWMHEELHRYTKSNVKVSLDSKKGETLCFVLYDKTYKTNLNVYLSSVKAQKLS